MCSAPNLAIYQMLKTPCWIIYTELRLHYTVSKPILGSVWPSDRKSTTVFNADMGRIALENNALNKNYLPKLCIELALPLLDFEKVMHRISII